MLPSFNFETKFMLRNVILTSLLETAKVSQVENLPSHRCFDLHRTSLCYSSATAQAKPTPNDYKKSAGKPALFYNSSLAVQIKPIQFHHLHPGLHKVMYKLVFAVGAGIDFGDGAQF